MRKYLGDATSGMQDIPEEIWAMENCLYQGKTICTFDLKDDSGLYYEDMVLDWKQAAADRLLSCMECGAHVLDKPSLDPAILEKCRKMIVEGNAHLVSKKYYDAIMGNQSSI